MVLSVVLSVLSCSVINETGNPICLKMKATISCFLPICCRHLQHARDRGVGTARCTNSCRAILVLLGPGS